MINKITYIIDDDKLTIKLMNMLLSRNSFSDEIIPFCNAQIALDTLQQNANNVSCLPDVILLDLNMPFIDGWQFLDAFMLLPLKKEIAIFIVTSSIDSSDIEMAKKYRMVKDYIIKPLNVEKIKMVSKMINTIS